MWGLIKRVIIYPAGETFDALIQAYKMIITSAIHPFG